MQKNLETLDRIDKIEPLKKLPLILQYEHQHWPTEKNDDFCTKLILNDSLDDRNKS